MKLSDDYKGTQQLKTKVRIQDQAYVSLCCTACLYGLTHTSSLAHTLPMPSFPGLVSRMNAPLHGSSRVLALARRTSDIGRIPRPLIHC